MAGWGDMKGLGSETAAGTVGVGRGTADSQTRILGAFNISVWYGSRGIDNTCITNYHYIQCRIMNDYPPRVNNVLSEL